MHDGNVRNGQGEPEHGLRRCRWAVDPTTTMSLLFFEPRKNGERLHPFSQTTAPLVRASVSRVSMGELIPLSVSASRRAKTIGNDRPFS